VRSGERGAAARPGILGVVSRAHVEAVKRVHDRWLGARSIDADAFHPEFEIRTPLMELGKRTHRGQGGYAAWRAANDEVYTDDWFEAAEFDDLGDRVLVTGWLHLKGRTSGIETREPAVQLWTFREGKPASMTLARTLEEAVEAAGLGE
jgi:hypothetical protein